jgi:hypothetical protein
MAANDTVQSMYNVLAGTRSVIEERIERYAGWTVPSAFPIIGTTETEEIQNDYQSFGAQAVNHLSNRLMMGLFSASRPFFRLDASKKIRDEIESAGVPAAELDTALQNAERESVKELSRMGARDPLTEMLKHLIIVGDSLLYIPEDDDKLQVYSLRNYVIKRNLAGWVIKIITCDEKQVEFLPDAVKEKLKAKKSTTTDDDTVKLYTYVRWDGERKKYILTQHVDEIQVSDTEGVYTVDNMPFISVTWKLLRGEDYGRGLVEDYAGDFHSMSVTEQAINELIGLVSQIKGLVNPAGITNVNELNNTPNGQWCSGREEDIAMISFDKLQDIAGLQAYLDKKERRLSAAFLMDVNQIRDAERVTAEEIRIIARSLETALGGVYTRLAQTLQLPIARRLMRRIGLEVAGNEIEPIIITGLDALSRSGDLESYRMFVQDATYLDSLGPETRQFLNLDRILKHIAANNSLDQSMAFNTRAEMEANAQQQAQSQQAGLEAEIATKAAPEAAKQAGGQ